MLRSGKQSRRRSLIAFALMLALCTPGMAPATAGADPDIHSARFTVK